MMRNVQHSSVVVFLPASRARECASRYKQVVGAIAVMMEAVRRCSSRVDPNFSGLFEGISSVVDCLQSFPFLRVSLLSWTVCRASLFVSLNWLPILYCGKEEEASSLLVCVASNKREKQREKKFGGGEVTDCSTLAFELPFCLSLQEFCQKVCCYGE